MALPTRSDVHVTRPLTNMSIAYIQDTAKDYIADKVFPSIPVLKQADRYFVYTKDYWQKTGAAKRADATESAGGGFHVDNTPTYFADVWAWHQDIGDQLRTNADGPLDLDRDATMFVTRNLLLKREQTFVRRFFSTGIWQGYLNAGVAADFVPATNGKGSWDTAASNPLQDVDYLKSQIKSRTGFRPNTLVVTDNVFSALKNNAIIVDRIKYTQTGIITEELLAPLFGVDKFLVAGAVLNTAAEGQPGTPGFINGNQFLLCYAAQQPAIMQPSAGYIFSWQGYYGTGPQGNRISNIRMDHLKADRIEGEMAYDMKLTGADLGVLGSNVLANP